MKIILFAAALLAWAYGLATASIYTFSTDAGASSAGLPVAARAIFYTSSNSVGVGLFNLIDDPQSIAQNLSGVSFGLSVPLAPTGPCSKSAKACIEASLGLERTIRADGSYSSGWSLVSTGWSLYNSGGEALLCVICDGVTAGDARHTIVGGTGSNWRYDTPGASLTESSANPHLAEGALFWLQMPGVTSATRVESVDFRFGTASIYGDMASESSAAAELTAAAIPEPPSALLLLGAGLLGTGVTLRRRRSATAAALQSEAQALSAKPATTQTTANRPS